MVRHDGRAVDQLREVSIQTGYVKYPHGSVLIAFGDTKVLCTVQVEESVPDHVKAEIKHFFTVYKSLEHKNTADDEVYGRDEAIRVIKECAASYKRNIQPKIVAERKARGF